MPIDLAKITAIDVHVHAEVSCHDPEDPVMGKFFDAASAYFKAPRERPKIPEIIDIYREQQIAFCLFTVDCESGLGAKRVSNYEIAEWSVVAPWTVSSRRWVGSKASYQGSETLWR